MAYIVVTDSTEGRVLYQSSMLRIEKAEEVIEYIQRLPLTRPYRNCRESDFCIGIKHREDIDLIVAADYGQTDLILRTIFGVSPKNVAAILRNEQHVRVSASGK